MVSSRKTNVSIGFCTCFSLLGKRKRAKEKKASQNNSRGESEYICAKRRDINKLVYLVESTGAAAVGKEEGDGEEDAAPDC